MFSTYVALNLMELKHLPDLRVISAFCSPHIGHNPVHLLVTASQNFKVFYGSARSLRIVICADTLSALLISINTYMAGTKGHSGGQPLVPVCCPTSLFPVA
jgi:hypothetical protein